jgi:hypothetical protein
MGEAYMGVGHELLNPFGERICVSKVTFRILDMRGYLQRDRETGLKQFKPSLVEVFLQLERTTYHRDLYAAIGPDFSGPATISCACRECQQKESQNDNTRMPGHKRPASYIEADTNRIIREVKSKRKIAA